MLCRGCRKGVRGESAVCLRDSSGALLMVSRDEIEARSQRTLLQLNMLYIGPTFHFRMLTRITHSEK